MPAESIIPDIPGDLLEDPETRHHLIQHVSALCDLRSNKFPGSQPVSFGVHSLDLLDKMDFWVCEKSDGVRVLLFIVFNGMTGNQEVWLIDRKQRYFFVQDLHFPHWERQDDPLTDTILDGELVIDIDPATGAQTLRYYAFDCLVLGGENIMAKPLDKRYARLREWVVSPMKRALQRFPEWKAAMPFDIVAKHQERSYSVSQVINGIIPTLQHGHDGLIFTCVESRYAPGTDENILKWKPPNENSIDFRIELRFPPSPLDPNECDYTAKPVFLLNQWCGGEDYEYFDEMDVDDEEWEQMKESREQYDDRIAEVTWDLDRQGWRMLRFRDDKPHGNHRDIVTKILQSIEDGVELNDVLARQEQVRSLWKQRESSRRGGPPKPPQPARPPPPNRRPTGPPPPPPPAANRPPAQGVMVGLKR